jgi:hypothetical protein
MDWTAIRCGLVGLLVIALVGGIVGWTGFVLTDRLRRTDAARKLEGAWTAGKDAGFRFDFGGGHAGTVQAWGPDVAFREPVRVIWRRGQEAVIAIGPDSRRRHLYLVTFTSNPDRITLRGEGEQAGTLLLLREADRSPQ